MLRSLTTVVVVALLVGLLWIACGQERPLEPASLVPPPQADAPSGTGLLIAPIEGITSAWHPAPARTAVPAGRTLVFACPATPTDDVVWTGATEVRRDGRYSIARSTASAPGEYTVSVTVAADDRRRRKRDGDGPSPSVMQVSCVLDAMPVAPGDIHVTLTDLRPAREPGQPVTNEETMAQFFSPSIASVRRADDGHYVTSVNRDVVPSVEVDPPGFLPLVESRVDGVAMQLGAPAATRWNEVGRHTVAIGPPAGRPVRLEVETYRTRITSHTQGVDMIAEGKPIVFTAVTDPPGFENDIVWISSTKHGTATPVLGRGATFTAQFDNTWGGDPQNRMQWLGVRADNAAVAQDGSLGPDAFVLIAPGLDTGSLLEGQTKITVAATGELNSPHTVTWSTDHPGVTVTPSTSTLNFTPGGELI